MDLKIISIVLSGWTFSEATGKHLDLIKPSSNANVTIYGRICWLY
jgi:DNA cross-link repair 1A protein